jgi:hypothetical protein
MEQVCQATVQVCSNWLRRLRGTSDQMNTLDVIDYYQTRNATARTSKKQKIPIIRDRKKHRRRRRKRKKTICYEPQVALSCYPTSQVRSCRPLWLEKRSQKQADKHSAVGNSAPVFRSGPVRMGH